jgi:tRNA(fMet)-specific endonuclease VapC
MLLDTSAYSALALGKPAAVKLLDSAEELLVPLQVVAELRYGFALGSQQQRNEQLLQRFLAQERVREIGLTMRTTEIYAQFATVCRQRGRALSQNDIWIAALAHEHAVVCVTYDQDFEALSGRLADGLVLLSD